MYGESGNNLRYHILSYLNLSFLFFFILSYLIFIMFYLILYCLILFNPILSFLFYLILYYIILSCLMRVWVNWVLLVLSYLTFHHHIFSAEIYIWGRRWDLRNVNIIEKIFFCVTMFNIVNGDVYDI